MQVGAIGASSPAGGASAVGKKDSQLEAIQKQIEATRKQLRELSQNDSLSPEEKLSKQKELQQRVSDLQQQLSERQRQIQEEQREQAASRAEGAREVQKPEETRREQQDQAMRDFLGLDQDLQQARKFDRARISMEGRAKVLESEIGSDRKNGLDVPQSKLDELSEMQSRIKAVRGKLGEQLEDLGEEAAEQDTAALGGVQSDEEKAREARDADRDGVPDGEEPEDNRLL